MRVLAVNAGSSSLKLSVVGDGDVVAAARELRDASDRVEALRTFLTTAGTVDAVAHRLVHGGGAIRAATVVDDAVRSELDAAATLAPLHLPPALRLLDAARELVDRPQVVCVDTAFHSDLPERATTYAIPPSWRDLGVRRYGFHGLSFAWSSRRAAELLERRLDDLQMLIAHVGAGVSVCAVHHGRSADTSMGFTPLEGAVMATRSGSVDPGALLWLQQFHGVGAEEMTRSLEHESGLLALCGSADLREVEAAAGRGDPECAAALDVYVHALCRNLAAVAASLQRVDALVFTGGAGEHSALLRSRVCARLGLLGIPDASGAADGDAVLSGGGSGAAVVVVAAREDAQMARETRALLWP
jgi:acetate kinase